tara:strand:+ start:293 stop:985 length:693 start_codon:yes stop_codon:yes gene_type:complete
MITKSLKILFRYLIRSFTKVDLNNNDFISNDFGFGRGTPIDRYYLEIFLKTNQKYFIGESLEFGSDFYLKKYNNRIKSFDVFTSFLDKKNSKNIIKGDLSLIEDLPKEKYDFIVCTNVLNFIYEIDSAIKGLHKMLKKNGICLISLAGFSTHVSRYDMDKWGDYWRLSKKTAIKIFKKNNFEIEECNSYGNVYLASAQMKGFCVEDIDNEMLKNVDNDYQMLITLRIKKK